MAERTARNAAAMQCFVDTYHRVAKGENLIDVPSGEFWDANIPGMIPKVLFNVVCVALFVF